MTTTDNHTNTKKTTTNADEDASTDGEKSNKRRRIAKNSKDTPQSEQGEQQGNLQGNQETHIRQSQDPAAFGETNSPIPPERGSYVKKNRSLSEAFKFNADFVVTGFESFVSAQQERKKKNAHPRPPTNRKTFPKASAKM